MTMPRWTTLLLMILLSVSLGGAAGYLAAAERMEACSAPAQQTDAYGEQEMESEETLPTVTEGEAYTVAEIAQRCTSSVISITNKEKVKGYTGGSEYSETVISHGTGVIIREDGYIVTCYHVVEGADTILVTLDDQREYTAALVGYDERFDLAVIRVDGVSLPAAALGDSDAIRSGEGVVVIGNPLGEFGFSVTAGVLSAPTRELTIEGTPLRLMQTDAAVNPGNSGGALLNMHGELIGIVNAKVSASGIEGIAFAIPWNSVCDKVESLISSGDSGKKAVLGASTKTAVCYIDGEKVECVEVVSLRAESAAEDAGMREGDFLLSADGKNLKSNEDLILTVKYHSPGDSIQFEIFRDGKKLELAVILGED